MARNRRGTEEHQDRDTGLDAALGLLSGRRPRETATGRTCSHCGARARIDMVDMARTRAYLTCRVCGHEWDTDRMDVLPGNRRR